MRRNRVDVKKVLEDYRQDIVDEIARLDPKTLGYQEFVNVQNVLCERLRITEVVARDINLLLNDSSD